MDICNANVIYFSINSQFSLKLIFENKLTYQENEGFGKRLVNLKHSKVPFYIKNLDLLIYEISFTIPIYFICALDHFKFHHQLWKTLKKSFIASYSENELIPIWF